MLRGSTTVTIHRPIEDVFAVLSDVEKTAIWHPATLEEYWTTAGKPGVGSKRVAVAKSFGIRSKNEAVVNIYEPNRALGLKSIDSPVPFLISIGFQPVSDGTTVEWLVEMEPTGLFRWFGAYALNTFIRQLDSGLKNLKTLMESGEL